MEHQLQFLQSGLKTKRVCSGTDRFGFWNVTSYYSTHCKKTYRFVWTSFHIQDFRDSILFVIVLLSIPLKFPSKDEGYIKTESNRTKDVQSYNPSTMLKTTTFWGLWLCFVIGTLSGLMAIGISSPVGQEIIKLSPDAAAISVSILLYLTELAGHFWLLDG